MKAMVITASPNHDGLTAASADAAEEGLRSAGVEVERANVNDLNIGTCEACNRGWGTCLSEYECQVLGHDLGHDSEAYCLKLVSAGSRYSFYRYCCDTPKRYDHSLVEWYRNKGRFIRLRYRPTHTKRVFTQAVRQDESSHNRRNIHASSKDV